MQQHVLVIILVKSWNNFCDDGPTCSQSCSFRLLKIHTVGVFGFLRTCYKYLSFAVTPIAIIFYIFILLVHFQVLWFISGSLFKEAPSVLVCFTTGRVEERHRRGKIEWIWGGQRGDRVK